MKTEEQIEQEKQAMLPLENRRQRRFKQRMSKNKKGNGLIVAKIGPMMFVKYKVVKQHIKGKLIIHTIAV